MRVNRSYGKRLIALVTALMLCITFSVSAAAAGGNFVDVPQSAWYYKEVMQVTEYGLFNGTDDTHFSPNNSLTRAMFVTVLWRYHGSPSSSGNKFSDVPSGSYYYNAVGWANKEGLVSGVSDTQFAPDNNITREQMATMMYRYANYLGKDTKTNQSLSGYSDGSSVASYAADAVKWALGKEMLVADNSKIRPGDVATRAEAAVMWARFMNAYSEEGGGEEEPPAPSNGKSAYELAVENGYKGTVQEWLSSLAGAQGKQGEAGKSAYEIAVEHGYVGTEVEWIRSLAGANGLSAYEIAKKNGYEGTELEWLESLVGETGKDGSNGKSAYELAVEKGFEGSEEDWLLTLVGPTGAAGKDGANGKSAFELAQENGFEGSLSEWLDSLVGTGGVASVPGKSAYELAVDNGFEGSEEEWLESLKGKDGTAGEDGASAYEIAVDNGFEGSEEEWVESLHGEDGKDGQDGENGVGVVNAYINGQLHLILVLSNGDEIDAGYVGVETNPDDPEETFTVTFKDYNGAVLKTETVNKGANATPPADPARDGYTFVGWSGSYTNVTKDVTVTAQYQENEPETVTYTVQFTDFDGTILKTQVVEEGSAASAPADPSREGYEFIGWDKAFDNVTSNLTVTALYELVQSDEPSIYVDNVSAAAGETGVQVAVLVKNNPGILGMTLKFTYDDSIMTLTGASNGDAMAALDMAKPGKFVSGCKFNWDALDIAPEDVLDGEILILTFNILNSAPSGSYPIQVSYTSGDIFDADWNDLEFVTLSGSVTIN